MGVWVPDGDGTCNGLLKFALNETNIENTLLIFVVSMSQPWNIFDSLNKWSTIIKEHVKKLNIDEKKLNELKDRQRYLYQNYQEPDETTTTQNGNQSTNASQLTNGGGSAATTPKATASMSSIFGKKEGGTPVVANTSLNDSKNNDDYLPLDPSILTTNLGIPTIVVVTKVTFEHPTTEQFLYKKKQKCFTFISHFSFLE